MANARKRLAVLFDAENIPHKHLLKIISAIDTYGDAIIKRAYADWMLPQLSAWRNPLHKYDIQAIQTLRIVAGKNLADIAMTVDAMDIMHEGIVDGVCIISSDSDFTPLVRRLQDGGLFVLGIGLNQTPAPFMRACNTFLKIENLGKQVHAPAPKVSKTKTRQLGVLIIQAMTLADSEWVSFGTLGQKLRIVNPNFGIKSYGFTTLSKGVESFPALFKVKQDSSVKSICLLVKNLAVRLIQAMTLAEGDWVSLSMLGQYIRQVDDGFDIGSYGFPSLKSGVEAFPKLFQLKQNDKSTDVKLLVKPS